MSSTDLRNFLTPIQPLTSIIGQIKHLLSCELIVHHPPNNFLTESKTEIDSGKSDELTKSERYNNEKMGVGGKTGKSLSTKREAEKRVVGAND